MAFTPICSRMSELGKKHMIRLFRPWFLAAAVALLGTPAHAGQNELFVLGSISELDDHLVTGHYRYTFGNEYGANNGFAIGVGARFVEYFNGTRDVDLITQRVSVGYRTSFLPNSLTTLMVGFENVSSSGDTGAFATLEHWQGLSNGDHFFVMVEGSTATEDVYAAANYAFAFDGFSIGPTASIYAVDGYTAFEGGLQANIDLAEGWVLIPSVRYRHAEVSGGRDLNGVVGTVGLYVSF